MSGIFGIVHWDGRPVVQADLERMRAAMAHRGPDGSRLWSDGVAGLGQLMLHSTPESLHEVLPFQDPDSGLVITADARIDNREELAAKLGRGRGRPRSPYGGGPAVRATVVGTGKAAPVPSAAHRSGDGIVADSQFILEAYKRWGEDCVEHLLGDFAFAIWDPAERKLFCARDHMGSRPLYYFQRAGLLAFASTAEAVTRAAGVPAVLSEARIADYLVFYLEGIDAECSFFDDVRRLPPAHRLVWPGEPARPVRYWQPDPEFELRLGSDAEYTEAMEEVLTGAVRCRLRGFVQPASMLSGGVDSSTVAVLARLQTRVPLQTCSAVSVAGEDCRETRNIKAVLALGGLRPRLLEPGDLAAWRETLEPAMARIEDPFDYHNVLLALMYVAARADGAVAVLDGLDGDTVASLTTLYPEYLIRSGRWRQAVREVHGIGELYELGTGERLRLALKTLKPSLAPDAFWRWRWGRHFRRMARDESDACGFSAGLAERVNLEHRLHRYYQSMGIVQQPTLRHIHARRVAVPYLTAGIERYAGLAACCGVEHRQPLLDRRFVEFCVSLPWDQKVRGGWSKHCLRRVAEKHLPAEVAWRRGQDRLGWKFERAWFEVQRASLIGEYRESGGILEPYLDGNAFSVALKTTGGRGDDGEKVRAVFNLCRWLQLRAAV